MPKTSKRGLGFENQPISNLTKGNNYLLAIGIGHYLHFPILPNAVKDVQDIVQVLKEKYQFLPDKIQTIFNKEATKDTIIEGFKSLVEQTNSNDNVIIYFSGHGVYDTVFKEGYWMPVNAQKNNESNFIPNSYIKKMLEAIRCHHLFVMVDSCFSDSLFNHGTDRVANRLEQDPSRWGLTSGKNEILESIERRTNSPFAESILYLLKTNKKPLGVAELCGKVIEVTADDSKNIPLGEPLNVTGHRGGQFIFHPKVDEAADWAIALSKNTIVSFQAFLAAYPNGQNASRAKDFIYDLEARGKWETVESLPENSVRELTYKIGEITSYVQNYDKAPDLNKALKVGELLEYKKGFHEAKGSIFKLRLFAQQETPFQEEAKQLIENFNVEKPTSIKQNIENSVPSISSHQSQLIDDQIQPRPQSRPEYENATPTTKKKKKIKNLLMIGISLLVILFAGGGLIYQKIFNTYEILPLSFVKDPLTGSLIIKLEEGTPPFGITIYRDDIIKEDFQHEEKTDLDITEYVDKAGDYELHVEDDEARRFSEKFTIGKDWLGLPENKLVPPSFSTKILKNQITVSVEEGNPPYQLQLIRADKSIFEISLDEAGEHNIDISEIGDIEGNYTVRIKDSKNQIENEEVTIIKESTPPTFEFEETIHDFGVINEGDKVTHVFEFTNIGSEPLKIFKVKPSSRSVKKYLSDEIIPSGEKGKISITFNSRGRTSKQKKTIKITANTNPKNVYLTIKANVKKAVAQVPIQTPKNTTSPLPTQPIATDVITSKGNYASIKLKQNSYNFGKVKEGEIVQDGIDLYNLSENELRISKIKTSCGECIDVQISEKIIAPKSVARVTFTFNTTGNLGRKNITVYIYGNTDPSQTSLQIKGVVERKPLVQNALPPPSYPHVTDNRDGQHYRIAKLKDGKIWMAENLNLTTQNSWCYGNKDSHCAKYGKLYTHAEALKACPQGWHLPTRKEWDNMIKEYGGYQLMNENSNGKKAYKNLMIGGQSGFRGHLSGIKGSNSFSFRKEKGFYWLADAGSGMMNTFLFHNKIVQPSTIPLNAAAACRCVKD